ncbi:MAG TPA: VWA domain-containing protein [Terriglobales bacterium]|nr:VWA domain-containing protein [Terriglobales bacterium]
MLSSFPRKSGLIVAVLLLALLSGGAFAQDDQKDQNSDQLPTFRSNVNVVNLFFNVKDKHGNLIPNLTKNDFQVFEDGKAQTIKYFAADADQPLTLGILLDTSASQERVLPLEKQVGAEFLHDVLRPKDLAFLISFDVNVDELHDFTGNAHQLQMAMDKAVINNGGGIAGPPGLGGGPIPTNDPRGTLLYDAVYLASHEKLSQEVGRKAMILLTDGEDQGSQMKMHDAIEAAQKADAVIYVLLAADRGFYGFGGYHGEGEMKKMTAETGGRVIEVGNKFEKMQEAFQQIAQELRSQYNIGYTPTNTKRDGAFRHIEIKVPNNKDFKIQSRNGYYAPTERAGD